VVLLLTRYVLRAAIRDKLPLIFIISLAVCLSLSAFLGDSAVIEQDQFVVIFAASSLRFLSVVFLILYISFYFHRAFETRDLETMLTRPFSRLQYLVGHYVGFQIIVIVFSLASFLMFFNFKSVLTDHYFIWFIGLFIELSLVALISIFFAMLCTRNVAAILLSFGFYILGRLSGSLLNIIEAGGDQNIVIRMGEVIMQVITVVVPRFDLMVQTSWLLYDINITMNIMLILIFQFFVFTGFILSATYFDLIRKQF
jgi:ABC-type transport system involved in multi-copper enzyme maturation permease subunit